MARRDTRHASRSHEQAPPRAEAPARPSPEPGPRKGRWSEEPQWPEGSWWSEQPDWTERGRRSKRRDPKRDEPKRGEARRPQSRRPELEPHEDWYRQPPENDPPGLD
ncbi:hypothetical protein E1298_27540, partial [Actinomadura rubrisoli]